VGPFVHRSVDPRFWTVETTTRPDDRAFDVTVDLLGMPFYTGSADRLLEDAAGWPAEGPVIITTVNMQHLSLQQRLPAFNDVMSQTDVATADGAPIVWLAKALGLPVQRIAGSDIVRDVIASLPETHRRVFLLGSDQGTLEAVSHLARTAGWPLAGSYSPSPNEVASLELSARICQMINEADTDLLILLLGVPKQDRWAVEHRDRLACRVILGAGGALDFIVGTKRRAPAIIQSLGLEWLFRLMQDPARLWRRYLVEYWFGVARMFTFVRQWRRDTPRGNQFVKGKGGVR
jgi:N-acetylglucosaminyldiphosphoundecaprenol N-acetyl-beta-D-mannosaminyltransferase